MKIFALILLLLPALGFATTTEPRKVSELRVREAELEKIVAEVRWLYREDRAFIAAFDKAQNKWEEYCAAALEARFPAEKKREEYGSVHELAYAAVKLGLVADRIREVSLWREGTEEGDVSAGSVMLKRELEEIRKARRSQPLP